MTVLAREIERRRPVASEPVTTPPGARPGRRRGAAHWPYLLPVLAALAIWVYGPLLATVALSFVRWHLSSGPATFVGLANYHALLDDPAFANSAWRTVLFAAGMLPLLLTIALWKRPGPAAFVYRCVLFAPMILAPVATAISWQFVLNPLQGVLHSMFAVVGVSTPNWLGDPHTALWAIVAITSGKVIALNVLLLSAALSTVQADTVDAARIDGASELQISWLVLVPQLRRTLLLLVALTLVYAGQWSFTDVAVLTQGGPTGSTDTIYYRLYTYGFTYFDSGRAAAGSTLLVIALAIPVGLIALLRRRHRAGA